MAKFRKRLSPSNGDYPFWPHQEMPRAADLDQRPIAQYQEWTPYITDLTEKLWSLVRIDDPDFALAHDVLSIEKIRRDAVIQQLITYRKHMVAGRDWHLEPGDESPEAKELAKILDHLIKKAKNFPTCRYRLADAVFLGLSVEKMVMKLDTIKIPETVSPTMGGQYMPMMYVHKFNDIDKRRIRLEYRETGPYTREYYHTLFNIHRRQYREITNKHQYIFHEYNNEEDTYGFGRGLNEAIFYYWRGKAFLLKYAQQYAEQFAKPWIKAQLADMKGTADSIQARASQWISVLEKMRGGNVIVGSVEDNFEFMAAPAGGVAVLTDLINYFDEALTRLIIGSTLGVRTEQSGTRNLGEIHEETTKTLVNYDRLIMQNTLSDTLVKALFEANFTIFDNAGFGEVALPKFIIDSKTKEDPLVLMQEVQLGQQIGMKFATEQVYERTGWRMPSDEEDVLEPPQPEGIEGMEGGDEEIEDGAPPNFAKAA